MQKDKEYKSYHYQILLLITITEQQNFINYLFLNKLLFGNRKDYIEENKALNQKCK
jgi:hypothetical protein